MKLRLALISATAIAASVASAQDPNVKVTFSTKAAGIEKVVDAIAKQTGAKIAASPAIANEIVLVSVKDVPLESLLAKLADVVSGEWKLSSDGIRYLNYDDSLFRRRSREAQARRIAAFKKDIETNLKQAAEEEAEMAKASGENEVEGEMPQIDFPWTSSDKWVLKILERLDPAKIVGVGDARIVFATSPTRAQLPLPNISDLIGPMIAEHNKTAEARAKAEAEMGEEDPQTVQEKAQQEQMERMLGGFMKQDDKPITAPPAKVILVVKRGGLMSMLGASAELSFFDAQGKRIYSASSSVDVGEESGSMDEIIEAAMPSNEPQQPKVDTTKPIEYSAESQEMMKLFDMSSMASMFGENAPKVSEGLLSKLRTPTVFDPLSFAPSDSLLFVASDRKLNVVAGIPDAITGMSDLMVSKGLTVGAFVERMQDNKALTIETKDGWFTVRPFDPESSKRYRVNRKALQALIEAALDGPPSMEAAAAYALANESPMKTEIVMPYITLFVPSIFMDMMMGSRGWSVLRLYGTLSASQRDALRAGGRTSFGSLTPQQRVYVEELVFGVDTALQVVDPTKPTDDLPDFMKMAGAMFGGNQGLDFRTEPTEVMPNGLPNQGVVAGNLEKKPILTPSGGILSRMGFDASMIAMFTMATQMPEEAGQIPEFGAMKLGERTLLNLRFIVAPSVEQTERISSDAASSDKTAYRLDNLPPSMKAAVEKEMAKLKKFGIFGGGMN